MDVNQLGPMFIANNLIQRMDLEKNFHLLVLFYLLYNYFPRDLAITKANEIWAWCFPPPPERNHVSVTFKVRENRDENNSFRSDRYLAMMNYIKNLPSIKHSEAIAQTKDEGSKDVSIYEICQNNEFLINEEKDIYGQIFREEVTKEKVDLNKITLVIRSYTLTHSELVKWIEDVKNEWIREWKHYLSRDSCQIFDIDWRKQYTGHSYHTSISNFESNVNFDNTFFPKKDLLIRELEQFKHGKETYKKNGQPWQYGILLSGIPGSGKTRILKCIANYMKRHVVNITLSDEFPVEKVIGLIRGFLPHVTLACEEFIVVFEEIADQTMLVGPREEKIPEEKLEGMEKEEIDNEKLTLEINAKKRRAYLSRLLPAIDGLSERNGGMIIMTTNYVNRLDSALLRPGRSDYHLHMEGGYDRQTVWEILKFQYPEFEKRYSADSIVDEMCDTKTGCEIAQLQRTLSKEEIENMFFGVSVIE